MNYIKVIEELEKNRVIFKVLLSGLTKEEYLWRTSSEKWCLLEIVCHLYDEECEDFRARTKHVLETPTKPLPSIDPVGWVIERKYIQKDYINLLDNFLKEREESIKWIQSLSSPKWGNAYNHPKFGQMTAKMFLSNWLAHDYLHIRQILKLKFDYLQQLTDETLVYAGDW